MESIFSQTAIIVFFFTLILLHLLKRNENVAKLYGLQSIIVTAVLFVTSFETGSIIPFCTALLTLAVKGFFAPLAILKLIRKNQLTFSSSSYVNTPLTLILLAGLIAIGHSALFAPVTHLATNNAPTLSLAFSAILISLFLIINKKGALSQIIGILSLENSIVFFALFADLEQSAGLQIGIVFDIFLLLIISTTFMHMLYHHFQSLDATDMEHLKD